MSSFWMSSSGDLMFKTARMQKFRVIFLQQAHDSVVAGLHEAGVVQLKEITELEVARRAVGEEMYERSSLLAKFREMQEFLGPSRKPVEVNELTYAQTLERAKKLLEGLEPRLSALKAKSEELDKERQELLAQMELLKNFREIEFSLNYLRSTDEIRITVGWIAEERVREFSDAAREILGQKVFVVAFGEGKRKILIAACRARDQQKLLPMLYRFEIELLEIPRIPRTPREAIKELEKQLEGLAKERADFEGKRKNLAKARAGEVSTLLELLGIQMERLGCAGLFGYTDATVVIEGWVPKKKADLDPILNAATNGRHIVRIYEPQKVEVEVVPIQMENPKVVEDFELITETYSMPRYDEVDPTPYLALTFPLFFALCLSDAGYGALLGIFMASGFWITKAFPRRLRTILIVSAIFTVVIGALIGGWFGGFFGYAGPLWVDPLKNPIPILKLAVFIGIIHILIGFGGAASVKDVFRRDWRDLVLRNIPRLLIAMGFFGLCFCALGIGVREFGIDFTFPKMDLFEAFNPVASAPVIVVAFRILLYLGLGIGMVGSVLMAQGLRERISGPVNVVYGITGLIADAASYSRLMALGIATGIIAFSINYILAWFYGSLSPSLSAISNLLLVPLLILLAFVFVAAHCFNIFIQSLGAFIHTMRLHYVEFFGKFYEGGGEKFTPFKAKRVFTKVKRR